MELDAGDVPSLQQVQLAPPLANQVLHKLDVHAADGAVPVASSTQPAR